MLKSISSILTKLQNCKVVFCDYTDTIIHKLAEPSYIHKLASKELIRELGLDLKIEDVYLLRQESLLYLTEKHAVSEAEIGYQDLIEEVYNRMVCSNKMQGISIANFINHFENSDLRAESLVQHVDEKLLNTLQELKSKGYKIYCLSNTLTSIAFIEKCLINLGINTLFDGIYNSSELNYDKKNTTFYNYLLNALNLNKNEAFGIVSNKANTKTDGFTILQVTESESTSNLKIDTTTDQERYRKIVRDLYIDCNSKSAPPHSDYILFYYVYIERLYKKAKKDKLKNIFFLAREGLFLKKLFDHYQEEIALNEEDKIKSHYFKASRNSLMLVSLKDIKIEEFSYLRRRWPDLSINSFLNNFHFSEDLIIKIVESAGLKEREKVVAGFLNTETFNHLIKDPVFIKAYDDTRNSQKKYFEDYLNSFNVDIKTEGIHISDVGWGGTMQNRLYDYFEEKIEVHGYYLGVREVNNIRERTKKNGLNFSVYPYLDFFDHILMANVELNEQLLAAGHGSTIAYTDKANSYTIEHHEENDKRVFEHYIEETQNHMFKCFEKITQSFKTVCYDYDLEQYEMTDHALRIGLFASKRKTKREIDIYKGFYQNVGNFSVGLAIGENFDTKQKLNLLHNFLLKPEEAFRYVLRLKPIFLRKKMYLFAYLLPSSLIYYYIKLRCYTKGLRPKK